MLLSIVLKRKDSAMAVKLYNQTRLADIRLFAREVSIHSLFESPHVVGYLGHGVDQIGRFFIALEVESIINWGWLSFNFAHIQYVPFGNLTKYRSVGSVRTKPSFASQWIRILRDTAAGMAHIHSLNIVHRDLSTDNVLVGGTAASLRAYVADFGVSKVRKQGFFFFLLLSLMHLAGGNGHQEVLARCLSALCTRSSQH
jgi:serine/threonine protein kinase